MANMLETKMLVNRVISDAPKGARFMSVGLKDFFLATPMEGDKFMKVQYEYFPKDIKKHYNLDSKVTASGHIYICNKKGVYGLKQTAILAYKHLKTNLAQYGYWPIVRTVGM